jgi:hypothetical protein
MSAIHKLSKVKEQIYDVKRRLDWSPKDPFYLQWNYDQKCYSVLLPNELRDQFNVKKVKLANDFIKILEKFEKELINEVKKELK